MRDTKEEGVVKWKRKAVCIGGFGPLPLITKTLNDIPTKSKRGNSILKNLRALLLLTRIHLNEDSRRAI